MIFIFIEWSWFLFASWEFGGGSGMMKAALIVVMGLMWWIAGRDGSIIFCADRDRREEWLVDVLFAM